MEWGSCMVTFNWRNVELPLKETGRLFVRRVIGGNIRPVFRLSFSFIVVNIGISYNLACVAGGFSALVCLWFCKVTMDTAIQGGGGERGEKTVRKTACRQFFSSLLLTPSPIIFSLSHHFWPSKMKITLKNHLLCSLLIIRFIKFLHALLF